ncbi:hypothetical protein C9I92_07200 [Photobacterium ganghwense]|uniref:Fervidolysin-like N-terminal prodomain domain-containing protein n=1 Tax=Photobacterium ganghwense TaxID=320778 RepID=A0A0J1HDW8_9GAMM|nr:hypothetical protein [Photobacterium ganghwense]KLV09818.1 hypothetical protein ABT57_09015 [Photobacterium ganghwense]PSU09344.1 hypothetical protein C9I92_07200 [Photobacterium ganghwense]QSV16532.1 hypothetical protein FH974_16165 [Photobacterium ganghwense]
MMHRIPTLCVPLAMVMLSASCSADESLPQNEQPQPVAPVSVPAMGQIKVGPVQHPVVTGNTEDSHGTGSFYVKYLPTQEASAKALVTRAGGEITEVMADHQVLVVTIDSQGLAKLEAHTAENQAAIEYIEPNPVRQLYSP